MADPFRELEHLSKLAAAQPRKRFGRLYRLVRQAGILAAAAERVRQNTGGRTAGIDGQTRRQISAEMLAELAADLAHGRYRAKAVRRAYIPKGKTGRRALQ
jgi:RNA-directed DNA polymerase